MTELKLHCSVQDIYHFLELGAQSKNDEINQLVASAVDFANEIFDIVHALAECQPHQFSSLKLRTQKLLQILEGGEN